MEAMGSKVQAKKLMADAGVPVLEELSPASLVEGDLPMLVKASAGGGGRGMRIVRAMDEVASAVELASAEATSSMARTMRMPRPPPPADALTSMGKSPSTSEAGDNSSSTGTPASAISFLAWTFEPMASIAVSYTHLRAHET